MYEEEDMISQTKRGVISLIGIKLSLTSINFFFHWCLIGPNLGGVSIQELINAIYPSQVYPLATSCTSNLSRVFVWLALDNRDVKTSWTQWMNSFNPPKWVRLGCMIEPTTQCNQPTQQVNNRLGWPARLSYFFVILKLKYLNLDGLLY